MPIATIRVAYKIGFSSSLNPDTMSAYSDMARWVFEGNENMRIRLKRAFCRGYKSGYSILRDVKFENKTAKVFTSPTEAEYQEYINKKTSTCAKNI